MRRFILNPCQCLLALLIAGCLSGCQTPAEPEVRSARPALSLSDFRALSGEWTEAGSVALNPDDSKRLVFEPGQGILVNGEQGRTVNILTKDMYGDARVHIEFMVPEGSNSGVYFQGRYELQVFDSWGVTEPQHSDCGGIYQRWLDGQGYEGYPPRVNASLRAGDWQSFDVIFRAPRFNELSEKTENARFVEVRHNGVIIHQDVYLSGPTRAATFEGGDEKPVGPIMLQGDHGPVAYRNLTITPLRLE